MLDRPRRRYAPQPTNPAAPTRIAAGSERRLHHAAERQPAAGPQYEGHAYRFDGSILASVELETGERAWKGGYGHGQLPLLDDQDLLLVLGEQET